MPDPAHQRATWPAQQQCSSSATTVQCSSIAWTRKSGEQCAGMRPTRAHHLESPPPPPSYVQGGVTPRRFRKNAASPPTVLLAGALLQRLQLLQILGPAAARKIKRTIKNQSRERKGGGARLGRDGPESRGCWPAGETIADPMARQKKPYTGDAPGRVGLIHQAADVSSRHLPLARVDAAGGGGEGVRVRSGHGKTAGGGARNANPLTQHPATPCRHGINQGLRYHP